MTFFFIFLESYTYLGFLKKFFLIDSRYFMFITMSISLIDVFNESDMRRSRQNSIKHLAYQLNTLLLPIIFTLYFILKIVENAHYPNYVFATFHIQQDTLVYGMFLGGWLILINSLKKVKTFFAKVFADLEKYWEFVLVIILLACLLQAIMFIF